MKRKLALTNDGYKHAWSDARVMFIEGDPDPSNNDVVHYKNLKQISEHFNIPYQQVRAKAGKERWSEERGRYQLQMAQKRRKLRAERLASESINFDDQSLAVAKVGQGLIAARFGEIAEEFKIRSEKRKDALRRMEAGEFVDPVELRSAVWFKEMSELAAAASKIQELGRRALGTDVENISIQLDQNVSGEISVRQEMENHTDSERLAAMLQAASRSKIPILDGLLVEEDDDEDVLDAEVIDDVAETALQNAIEGVVVEEQEIEEQEQTSEDVNRD